MGDDSLLTVNIGLGERAYDILIGHGLIEQADQYGFGS